MLILVAVVAILLGYSQSRRRQLFAASEELKKYGYIINLPNEWHDYFWQDKPKARSFFRENRDLLLLDVEDESDNSSPIQSLSVMGFTPAVVREMEIRRTQELITRIERNWASLTSSARSSELQDRYLRILNDAKARQAELESRE
jgi:hypothetical protein